MAYLHVKATVDDFESWKAAFEGYHERRASYGGTSYQLYRSVDDPNEIVVLVEFDEAAHAREWTDYLAGQGELTGPEMADVEVSYLELTEQQVLSPA